MWLVHLLACALTWTTLFLPTKRGMGSLQLFLIRLGPAIPLVVAPLCILGLYPTIPCLTNDGKLMLTMVLRQSRVLILRLLARKQIPLLSILPLMWTLPQLVLPKTHAFVLLQEQISGTRVKLGPLKWLPEWNE